MSSYSTFTDEQLAHLCQDKDPLALEELMHRHMKHIWNFVKQYVRAREDADDITQDSFFKAWKYMKTYSAGKKFLPWLFTIARNTALDHIKKKKALPFSDLDDVENDIPFADTISDSEPLPPEVFDTKDAVAKLTQALLVLHPDHRSVLTLHYQDGMTFDEIAEVLDKPMNTVKSWHHRALIKVRTELEQGRAPNKS